MHDLLASLALTPTRSRSTVILSILSAALETTPLTISNMSPSMVARRCNLLTASSKLFSKEKRELGMIEDNGRTDLGNVYHSIEYYIVSKYATLLHDCFSMNGVCLHIW
jgi:hypothetical protein